MRIIRTPQEYNEEELFLDLRGIIGRPLLLKCEGFNFARSIKLKAAAQMIAGAEADGLLRSDSTLVESSSGNLGVALSVIAASRGLPFLCVADSRSNASVIRTMEALGSQVHVITDPDPTGGFLGARLRYVRELCASDSRYVWLNQYTNQNNWLAHYQLTAPAIAANFPELDVLFVGAGTTGTLMGCARYLRDHRPEVKVVAIDSVGSVSFGGPPAPRMIPGLGAGVVPPMLQRSFVDDVVHVAEPDSIRACRRLARAGFLFGGSTGTVVSGALSWLRDNDPEERLTAIAISPDLGDHYVNSIYHEAWLSQTYGDVFTDHAVGDSPLDTGLPAALLV